MQYQGAQNSQNNLENEEQVWMCPLFLIQNMLQTYSKQNSMVLALKYKFRNINQWKRTDNPEINPCVCG